MRLTDWCSDLTDYHFTMHHTYQVKKLPKRNTYINTTHKNVPYYLLESINTQPHNRTFIHFGRARYSWAALAYLGTQFYAEHQLVD